MKRAFAIAAAASVLLGGCALRPRYKELVTVEPTGELVGLRFAVVDAHSGVPVPGARIELGEKNKVKETTDAQGQFTMPVDRKYADENALVVVTLPKGIVGYRLVPVPGAELPGLGTDLSADAGVTSL